MSIVSFVVFPALVIVIFFVIYWIGRAILGPIDRAARQCRAPGRISIGDLLCLFVAVQLPLAFVSRLRSLDTVEYYWLFSILAWLVAPIIWVVCALTLSRAGISSGKHRLMFMGLVLPIVYYGAIPFVVSAVCGIVVVILGNGAMLLKQSWLVAIWAAVGAALIGCGRYTKWLVQQPATQTAEQHYPREDSSASCVAGRS